MKPQRHCSMGPAGVGRFSSRLPVFLVVVACSSSSSTATTTSPDAGRDGSSRSDDAAGEDAARADAHDARPDVIVDPQNCVAPTVTTSSASGVGAYCSPSGGQCVQAGAGGTTTLCTADGLGAPPHEWFCTIACTTTTDCGLGGGTCVAATFGQICVPAACLGGLGDAGATALDASDGSAPDDAQAAPDATSDDGATEP